LLTVVCERPGVLKAEERPTPIRRDDEILVRIRRVGVCGTDLHIFAGDQPYLSYPRVMGHELAGVAEAVPAGSSIAIGDTVSIIPYLSCGSCAACRKGRTNCCQRLEVLGVHRDGGMVELLSVPERFVFAAGGLDLDQAAMVEFLAIGAHAVRRSGIGPGDSTLVIGAGPIGIAVALFARRRGAAVTLLDRREDRLRFCTARLGFETTLLAGEDDAARLSAATGGNFYEAVFDATGNPAAMEQGFGFVAHGGTYVLVSIVAGMISFSDPEFHKRETTLLGSRNATREDFDTVVHALQAGEIPADALATHRLTLADAPSAFPTLLDPASGVVKALVTVP
jgi:2-desacetyl-2-hydroxyethyl bacteriochlorophyllide A dehydrogenase